ncbi:MAG: hypothetical protein RIR70_953 [Pseudomonadota bacterium]|jgi:hypothetical protein
MLEARGISVRNGRSVIKEGLDFAAPGVAQALRAALPLTPAFQTRSRVVLGGVVAVRVQVAELK